MRDESLEGWFDDPYGRHESRWLSMGRPTALVRDFGVEGSDPVEAVPFEAASLRRSAPAHSTAGPTDLLRADDSNRYSRLPWRGRRDSPQWTGQPPSPSYLFTQGQATFGQGAVPVDSARPRTVALFVTCGVVGWSLLGAVLVFAPAPWVAPVLAVSFAGVCAHYAAWWRLGGSITALRPRALTLMDRVLGLPVSTCAVLVYASMTWFAVSVLVRWNRGAAPLAPGRHWILETAGFVLLFGAFIAWILLVADRVREWIGGTAASRGGRVVTATGRSWPRRLPLRRWAAQTAVVFATASAFALVAARLA